MKTALLSFATLAALSCTTLAHADPRKDESGKHRSGEGKQVFYEGSCKIEREWKEYGEYKEERECAQRPRREYRREAPPEVIYYPEPGYRQVVPVDQGVVIQGTIRTK